MAGYLLNLVFDKADPAAATGLFNDDDSSSPTTRSKVWYTAPNHWPPAGSVGPNGQVTANGPDASWAAPLPDSRPLACAIGDDIYLRYVPTPAWNCADLLRFTVVFGRAHGGGARSGIATPFVLSNDAPCALFTTDTGSSDPTANQFMAGAADASAPDPPGVSWIIYLGAIAQNAAGQKAKGQGPVGGRRFAYSCIVGATALSGGTLYTFGHDPEMDVTG